MEAAKQEKIKRLKAIAVNSRGNPTVIAMVERELSKLEAEPKPEKVEHSPLGRLTAERDALRAKDPNHPDLKTYEQAITKFQPGGVQVNVHPNAPLIPAGL